MIVQDATYSGENLVNRTNTVSYRIGAQTASVYNVTGRDLIGAAAGGVDRGVLFGTTIFFSDLSTETGSVTIGLATIANALYIASAAGFAHTDVQLSDFDEIIARFDSAISATRATGLSYSTIVSTLEIRKQFNSAYQTIQKSTAERLVAADLNEEGANLVTLQTRRDLGIEALAAEGRNTRSILNLLR